MSFFPKLRKLARRLGLLDRHPRGGLNRDRTIFPQRGDGQVELSPFKKSKSGKRAKRGDSHFLDLVSALKSQGYSREEARRRASRSTGKTFDERLRSALR